VTRVTVFKKVYEIIRKANYEKYEIPASHLFIDCNYPDGAASAGRSDDGRFRHPMESSRNYILVPGDND
jgi:hypothetical protein